MGDLYLIRHGQASFGAENYDRLSPLGVRQAQVLARHLVRTNKIFNTLYYGRMDRHLQTAQELLHDYSKNGLDLPRTVQSKAFDEYDSRTVWEMQIPLMLKENPALEAELEKIPRDQKTFQKIFAQVMQRWISGACDPPQSPRWADFKQRVGQGIEALTGGNDPGTSQIVFTSGGPICVAVQAALGLSDHKTLDLSWQLMNASITRFKYNRREIALAGFNDVAHLELEGNPALLTYR